MEWITKGFGWLYREGKPRIEIECPESMRNDIQEFIHNLNGKQYKVTIKEYKPQKSNDANAYCWVLLGELSKVLNRSDEDIYRELIPCIGGNNYILPIKDEALETWIFQWEHVPKTKIGWTCKVLGACKNIPGYTNTINYYGSSMYDSVQMSRLIDLVVQECEQQGIETRTPQEIQRLKDEWKSKGEKE